MNKNQIKLMQITNLTAKSGKEEIKKLSQDIDWLFRLKLELKEDYEYSEKAIKSMSEARAEEARKSNKELECAIDYIDKIFKKRNESRNFIYNLMGVYCVK